MSNNSIKITGLIVGTVLIVTLIGLYAFMQSTPGEVLTASGIAEITIVPDVVGIYFNVQTNGSTSKEAKDANSKIADDLIIALLKEGFDRDEIETTQFSVNERYDWSNGGRKLVGYIASHRIRVRISTENKEAIGSAIDVGIDTGASLNYINYELSRDLENQYKAEALRLAGEDAKMKAEAMAGGLGLKLGKVVSISDSNFDYYPMLYADGMEMASMDSRELATNIQPAEQTISGRISVIYKLK
jgi:uncharacterized protein